MSDTFTSAAYALHLWMSDTFTSAAYCLHSWISDTFTSAAYCLHLWMSDTFTAAAYWSQRSSVIFPALDLIRYFYFLLRYLCGLFLLSCIVFLWRLSTPDTSILIADILGWQIISPDTSWHQLCLLWTTDVSSRVETYVTTLKGALALSMTRLLNVLETFKGCMSHTYLLQTHICPPPPPSIYIYIWKAEDNKSLNRTVTQNSPN
jgi:hypothetical protein